MKKTSRPVITGIVTAIILLVAFVSCGNLNSEKNSSIIVQLNAARSSLQYQKSDVSYYIVTISPDPNGEGEVRFDRTKTSHAFEGLPSGKYTITVKAYNESNILVAEGSDEDIEVIPGETATAVVEMEAKTYHVHEFATEWTTDGAYHWHAATCGDTEEVQDKAEHTFGDWITVTPATEENEGLKKQVCSICNYEKNETIPLLNHTHTWVAEWTYDESNHWHKCTSSKCSEIDQFAEHSWVDKENTYVAPTCTEPGSKTQECSVCGKTRPVTIPATGHNRGASPVTITKEPKCFTDGEQQYTCEYCGEPITEPIPALGWCETPIDAETFMPATKSSSLVYFGVFPQTVLPTAQNSIITEATITQGGVTYYKGTDGEYYVKTAVKPYTEGSFTYKDGTTISSGNRYFRMEPLKWIVLDTEYDIDGEEENETAALLFSKDVLTAGNEVVWYEGNENHKTTRTDKSYYEDSQARAYLNGIKYDAAASAYYQQCQSSDNKWLDKGFLQQAFTDAAKEKIKVTSVDNSKDVAVTGNPTNDLIFLLSLTEYNNYKDILSSANHYISDYAFAKSAVPNNGNNGTTWWLRSSNKNSGDGNTNVYRVTDLANAAAGSTTTLQFAMSPALCIDLPDAN